MKFSAEFVGPDGLTGKLVLPFTTRIWYAWLAAMVVIVLALRGEAQTRVQFPQDGLSTWNSVPAAASPSVYSPYGGVPIAPAPTYYPVDPNPTFRPNSSPWLGNLFGTSAPQPFPANPTLTLGQPYGYQPYPASPYPNATPNVLFPGSGSSPPLNSTWNFQNNPGLFGYQQNNYNWNNWWANTSNNLGYQTNQVIRLFQGPRIRHTWLPGSSDFGGKKSNGLETNDTDVSLVFAIPTFLGSNRPLYIIPSYSQHEWTGPRVPGSDLPGSAFSAFLDTGWESNPLQTLGAELGVRVGVFSAFDAISTQSIRIQGKGLARLRLTPTTTLRAGVYYLDRNRVKLLPAVGVLWMPNQDTRFDIFFPEPKLSHYLSTLGNTDVWWYLTGYYGGGAWTMKRVDGTTDEIDINDVRVMIGLEYGRSDQMRQGMRVGFVEGGYAFNRELLFKEHSANNLSLDNSFVIRAGIAY